MSHEIALSVWQEQWLDRTYYALSLETGIFIMVLASVGLVASIVACVSVFGVRRAVKNNPSDRAALFAKSEKRMLAATRCHWYLSNLFNTHSIAIWLVDAGIGFCAIAKDVSESPEEYNAKLWLELAISGVGMLAIFTAVFILFPAVQMAGVGWLVARYQKNPSDGTLAIYIPAARQLTTHMGYMWSLSGLLMMIWWPVFERTTLRLILLEAIFGSAFAWMHASYLFNFCAERFEGVEVQPDLSFYDGVKLYGQQIYAVHAGKDDAGLPKYEDSAQTPLLSEKTGL